MNSETLFEKFAMMGQLEFEDGKIRLFGYRSVLVLSSFFSEMILLMKNSRSFGDKLAEAARKSFGDSVARKLGESYKFSINDFVKWDTDIGIMAGWGILRWEYLSKDKRFGEVFLEGSPIAATLKGKVKSPVDHVMRGFIKGAAQIALKEEVEVVEEECAALGAERCRFSFVSKSKAEEKK